MYSTELITTPSNTALPTILNPTYFNPTYQSLIDSFLSGRNQMTIEAYRQDLDNFCSFLKLNTEVASLDDAAKVLLSHGHGYANALALKYKTHLIDRGLSPNTINRKLAALRSLVKLARTLGMVSFSLEIQNMKAEAYRDTKGPGKAGFKAMLDQTQNPKTEKKKTKAVRDQAILRLLYDLGLRRGEVVSLVLQDVDIENGTIAVMGKGRTQKVSLTLPQETRSTLSAWIELRGEEPGPLFINLDPAGKGDGRLCANGLYRAIRAIGKKAGIRTRPHGLRHSAITQALDLTNGNYQAVAKFSRHKNVQVITLYDDNRKDLGGNIAAMVAANVAL